MRTTNHIDEELVEAYRAGDKSALAKLVKRWHKLFCDKAYWLVRDRDVAKDIAQESWTTIMCKIKSLKEPKQFKYWAYRIVCNKATDWLRLEAKKRKTVIGFEVEIKSSDKPYAEENHLKSKLLSAINNLPTNQKTVVRLFYTESYSLKQISELLNISVGTAKSRLFHAREKLKKELKAEYKI